MAADAVSGGDDDAFVGLECLQFVMERYLPTVVQHVVIRERSGELSDRPDVADDLMGRKARNTCLVGVSPC
jgi:hypothetical protein